MPALSSPQTRCHQDPARREVLCTPDLITSGTCSCLPPLYTLSVSFSPSSSLKSPPCPGFQMLFLATTSLNSQSQNTSSRCPPSPTLFPPSALPPSHSLSPCPDLFPCFCVFRELHRSRWLASPSHCCIPHSLGILLRCSIKS